MSSTQPKFLWLIRTWCSLDSFWEHVREHKDYDIAYTNVESVMDEIKRLIAKQHLDWDIICANSPLEDKDSRRFDIDMPSLEHLRTRSFVKFLSVVNTGRGDGDSKNDGDMTAWYVERLNVL